MSAEVLLVDDDRAALYALSEILSDLPVRLTLVESGEDALRQVLKHEFAAILLDVRLPKMDGFEVAAAIRSLERSRQTPDHFHERARRSQKAGETRCRGLPSQAPVTRAGEIEGRGVARAAYRRPDRIS